MTNPYRVETVYLFICDYVAEHKTGPLVTEIAEACNLSFGEARSCVTKLVKQQRVRKTFRWRSIAPVEVPESEMVLSNYRLNELKSIETFGRLRFD